MLINGLKLPETTAAVVSETLSLALLLARGVLLDPAGAMPITPPSLVHPASKALRHATANIRLRAENFARIVPPCLPFNGSLQIRRQNHSSASY
ncbi:hypothetical protein DLREEDagr8_19030 [Dongia sp. agr-C8]